MHINNIYKVKIHEKNNFDIYTYIYVYIYIIFMNCNITTYRIKTQLSSVLPVT